MRVVNIEWDADGDKEIFEDLPKEIEIPDGMTEDEVSEYLSDITGFCHKGYQIV